MSKLNKQQNNNDIFVDLFQNVKQIFSFVMKNELDEVFYHCKINDMVFVDKNINKYIMVFF